MKRALKFDGTDIELVLCDSVKLKVPRPFMYLWEQTDGTWKLEYSEGFLSTFAALKRLEFQPEEPVDPKKKAKKQFPAFIKVELQEGYAPAEDDVSSLLKLDRVTGISGHRGARFIHLEFINKAWRLSYWKSTIPEITQVKGITVIRED